MCDRTKLITFIFLYMQAKCFVYCQVSNNTTGKTFNYNIVQYNVPFEVSVNSSLEQILDFTETSNKWRIFPTRVCVSTRGLLDHEHPVYITATQQKDVASWQLPRSGEVNSSRHMARTLCPLDAGANVTDENRPMIHVATTSPVNVSIDMELNRVTDFYVELNKEVIVNVTPSTPQVYFYSFTDKPDNVSNNFLMSRLNYTAPKSVIVTIDSDDELCAIVSIQNNSCPVLDDEHEVVYRGYHLTMTKKGGITITQSMYPAGFYVVLIVKEDDEDCVASSPTTVASDGDERIKNFRFRVIPTISYKEYVFAALLTIGVILTFYAVAATMQYLDCAKKEQRQCVEAEASTSAESTAECYSRTPVLPVERSPNCAGEGESLNPELQSASDTDSVTSSELIPLPLTLSDLSRSRPKAHNKRSDRYFWSALTVAIVYALPVVQLLTTYQQMVYRSGDQDVCYYNFLCAHPLGQLTDFNHIYSNVGYIVLGLLFIVQLWKRQMVKPQQNHGIPQHHGLLYSMALALIMEGVLSGLYHLCPNKMNFQFDSSFMYVIAVLCMVKLYQNRHPDVNARAHTTFVLLAAIMIIGMYGIMKPSVYFWSIFTVLHLMTCLLLTLKIYYIGRLKIEFRMVHTAWVAVRRSGRRALVPNYRARAILLAIANAANWSWAIYGVYEHKNDFGQQLLGILIGNTLLYTLFYLIMKCVHRERMNAYVWLYVVLAHLAWFTAFKFYYDSKTKWSLTPAESRRRNGECILLDFYDSHDLWHFCSAAALFLSFNLLLTIDDGIANTPRTAIPVF